MLLSTSTLSTESCLLGFLPAPAVPRSPSVLDAVVEPEPLNFSDLLPDAAVPVLQVSALPTGFGPEPAPVATPITDARAFPPAPFPEGAVATVDADPADSVSVPVPPIRVAQVSDAPVPLVKTSPVSRSATLKEPTAAPAEITEELPAEESETLPLPRLPRRAGVDVDVGPESSPTEPLVSPATPINVAPTFSDRTPADSNASEEDVSPEVPVARARVSRFTPVNSELPSPVPVAAPAVALTVPSATPGVVPDAEVAPRELSRPIEQGSARESRLPVEPQSAPVAARPTETRAVAPVPPPEQPSEVFKISNAPEDAAPISSPRLAAPSPLESPRAPATISPAEQVVPGPVARSPLVAPAPAPVSAPTPLSVDVQSVLISPQAKSADVGPREISPTRVVGSPRIPKFLTPVKEGLSEVAPEVGTAVAKSSSVMASSSLATPANSAEIPSRDYVAGVASVEAPAVQTPTTHATPARGLIAPETLTAAHRAVDAVLASTERFTPSTQSVANLKLAVGDSELLVRVEVRAGEVHATFRTDSPELRAALSHEWRAAALQSTEQPLRMAVPVFASAERSFGDSGAGSSHEQPAQHREQPASPSPEFLLPGSSRGKAASSFRGGDATATTPPLRALPFNTQHLHAFA